MSLTSGCVAVPGKCVLTVLWLSTWHSEEHHVTNLLSAPNSHVQDEGADFGLAGVSSEVRTDNVLIASFFCLSLSQAP